MVIMTAIGIRRLHTVNEVVFDVTGTNLARDRYIIGWFRSIHSGVRRTTALQRAPPRHWRRFFPGRRRFDLVCSRADEED